MSHYLYKKLIWFYLVSTCWFYSCQHELKIGDALDDFSPVEWINSRTIDAKDLKNKVVLIRWWTDQCDYCTNTADALNGWYEKFSSDSFMIIGFYHPKPFPKTVDYNEVVSHVIEKNFAFPIGIDAQWSNLKRFFNDQQLSKFTSLSILIDRQQKVRWIHHGGEYHRDSIIGHEQCVVDFYTCDSLIIKYLHEE